MSTIISLDDVDAAFDKAVATLSAGSVVVLPVGGVYTVVADAFRASATQRIFAARRRSRSTPLPVLIRSERQVSGLVGAVPEAADRLMAAYWPGDLTLILQAGEGLTWDLGQGKGTVQLRLPADDFVLRLIGSVGPLACTAANRLDQDRPTTVMEAKQQLGVLVPVYLDGGERDGSVSTIVDCTGPSLVVRREGTVPELHVHLVGSGELSWGDRPTADAGSSPPAVSLEKPAEVHDPSDAPGAEEAGDGHDASAVRPPDQSAASPSASPPPAEGPA